VTGYPRGGGRPGRSAEDRTRATDVRVHAGLGNAEERGDLLRRETARDGAQYLTLTIGQSGD